MNRLTKTVTLLASAALMVGLSACGNGNPQPQPQAPAEAQAPAPEFHKFTANTEQKPYTVRGYSSDEITMPDGLIVRCLRYYDGGSSTSVIDCNWNGAHR